MRSLQSPFELAKFTVLVCIAIIFKLFNKRSEKNGLMPHWILERMIKSGSDIIEIGAHLGQDTKRFCNYPVNKIHIFEPDPRTFKVIKDLNLGSFVILNNWAIGNHEGKIKFYQTIEKNPSTNVIQKYSKNIGINDEIMKLVGSASSSTKFSNSKEVVCETDVDIERLDDYALRNNIDEVGLLWIDVQGSEKDVLAGATNIIKNTCLIWIEYGESEYEGYLTRDETIDLLRHSHQVVPLISNNASKGNLLFKRR